MAWKPLLAFLVIHLYSAPQAWTADIDDETCLACHEEMAVSLDGTPHELSSRCPRPAAIVVGCIDCHSRWEEHLEEPDATTIGNPAIAKVDEVNEICRQCHAPHAALGNVAFDPHFNQETSCVDCHTVHAGPGQLRPDDPAVLCSKCHVGAVETFARRSSHPLSDGAVTCISCHSFTGALEPTVGHGGSANCYSCHPDQSGPFLHEHPVSLSFAVEGGGCTECHQPHGSANERLLAQKGNTLCQQCHGVPPGHRIEHSGLGSHLQCVECHSEVHGSNHNSKFLDPDLGVKLFPNCYQSGCHDLNP